MMSWKSLIAILQEQGLPFLALILGDRGSGKTNLALLLAELASAQDLAVDILLPGSYEPQGLPPKRTIRTISNSKKFKQYLKGLRNKLVIIDEGLISLNARERRRGLPLWLAKLSAVGRHRSVYFVITSQAHRIDIQIRELADAVIVKKTDTARLLVLDQPPRRIRTLDRAARVLGKSLDTLSIKEAIRVGYPITDIIYDIPKSKYSHLLDKRAKEADIDL